ncbi:MAG: VanZ family protein [Bacilli bacterium]|nr:VanZ family protein [Bacilli bacterium]
MKSIDLRSSKLLNNLSKILFIIYLLLFVWVIIFKCNIDSSLVNGYQYLKTISLKERFMLYLIPFKKYETDSLIKMTIDMILNIIIFIPFGLYLSYFIKKNKFIKTLVISIGVTLFIEFFQLFSLLGSFQTEDIIVNILGGVLGYTAYLLIYKDNPYRIKILNICSLVAIFIFLPVLIYGLVNTIKEFDLYVSIVTRSL